jgi:hypothetical protein
MAKAVTVPPETQAAPPRPLPQTLPRQQEGGALDHALRLLSDPKATDLHARHAAALERLARRAAAAGGFAVAEAPRAAALLELSLRLACATPSAAAHAPRAAEASAGDEACPCGASAIGPVCALLRLLCRPLLRQALSDEARLPGALTALLAALPPALAPCAPPVVQLAAAEAIEALATGYHTRPSLLQLQAARDEGRAGGAAPAGPGGAAAARWEAPPSPLGAGAAEEAVWRTYHLCQRCASEINGRDCMPRPASFACTSSMHSQTHCCPFWPPASTRSISGSCVSRGSRPWRWPR